MAMIEPEGMPPADKWRLSAACRGVGTEAFFPGRGDQTSAKTDYCDRCTVTVECLSLGLNEKFGIWGGASELKRRTLRRTHRPEGES
jgi:WhiB family redox-sensing transcriptional regulator